MADLGLVDYSAMAGLGEGVKGFIQGMNDSEDRKQKKLEFDAKMQNMKSEQEKRASEEKLNLYKAKLIKGPNGEYQDAPYSNREINETVGKASEHGNTATYDDSTGKFTYAPDPQSLQSQKLAQQAEIAAVKEKYLEMQARQNQNFRQDNLDTRKDRMDRSEHEHVLSRINANPVLKQRLLQYQNLDNSLSNITNAESLTPQMIMEFQQAVRSNLGIKGGSGIEEREETYMKSAGMNVANWKQFITGDPVTLSKDSKMVEHFRQLAKLEQANIRKQYEKSLKAGSGGHASMYGRRQDLKDDLDDAIRLNIDQVALQDPAPQAPVSQAPAQGMLTPQQGMLTQRKGLLSTIGSGLSSAIGGLFGSPRADAGQTSPEAAHPQDNEAVKWAKANLKDPRAAAILKANGL